MMKPITVTIAVNGNTVKTATFVNVNFYNEFKRIREAPEPLLAVRSALCKEMDYTGGLEALLQILGSGDVAHCPCSRTPAVTG